MTNPLKLLTLAACALLLSGCVVAIGTDDSDHHEKWAQRQAENRQAIADLEIGRSRSSVEAELGAPDLIDTFRRNGDDFVVLFYRTQRVHGDGETTRDETTPLVFVDDALVGWGDSAVKYAAVDG